MALENTQNPYVAIGKEMPTALNAIIAALPVSPTVDDLVDAVVRYVSSNYYSGANKQVMLELGSIAYNAINSFNNNHVLQGNTTYCAQQGQFIDLLIGGSMIPGLQPDEFLQRIFDIQDNIGTSDLNVNNQVPLFLATAFGGNSNIYWAAEVASGTSAWAAFFSSNDGQNYLNIMQWSVAAMNGALAGYGATPMGLVEPTTNMVSNNILSAFIGALTVSAGKLMFNWVPKITKPMNRPAALQRIGSPVFNNTTNGKLVYNEGYHGGAHSMYWFIMWDTDKPQLLGMAHMDR